MWALSSKSLSQQEVESHRHRLARTLFSRRTQDSASHPVPAHRQAPVGRADFDFSRIRLHSSPEIKQRQEIGQKATVLNKPIQKKLMVNGVGDSYEREADRISAQVTRTPVPQLQRACSCGGTCASCQKKQQQVSDTTPAAPSQTEAPPIVHNVLRSPGHPLDQATRSYMEPRFGWDFSRVRIHSDPAAHDSAQAVNARAYTVGSDIVFAQNQFSPSSAEGRSLLAHELTHVVQQTAISNSTSENAPTLQRQPASVGKPDDPPAGQSLSLADVANPPAGVGLRIPAHPHAVSGIHEWDESYAVPEGRATNKNRFRIGAWRISQICNIDEMGKTRVHVYLAYKPGARIATFAVGPDSLAYFLFTTFPGQNLIADPRNTDLLDKPMGMDATNLPAAPDAFKEEPQIGYMAPKLPRYDEPDPPPAPFRVGIYLMRPYLRRLANGQWAVLYYIAERQMTEYGGKFRSEYVVGPAWLEFFKQREDYFANIAELAFLNPDGEPPPEYVQRTARYMAGILHGDPERAEEGLKAWEAAAKDPFWWLSVASSYAGAAEPEPALTGGPKGVVPRISGEPVPAPVSGGAVPAEPAPVRVGGATAAGRALAVKSVPEPLPAAPQPAPAPRPQLKLVVNNPSPVPVAPRVSPPSPVATAAAAGASMSVGTGHAINESPKPAPKAKPKPKPAQDDKKNKKIYPICWPTLLPPPIPSLVFAGPIFFTRVTSPDRDYAAENQKALEKKYERVNKGDFPWGTIHVHHVLPLFLGGPDDLRNVPAGNGFLIERRQHLRGHDWLRYQPQLKGSAPVDIYAHSIGTAYFVAGFKSSREDTCGNPKPVDLSL